MLQSRRTIVASSGKNGIHFRAAAAIVLLLLGATSAYLLLSRDPAGREFLARRRVQQTEEALARVDEQLDTAVRDGADQRHIEALQRQLQRLNVQAMGCSLALQAQRLRDALEELQGHDYRTTGSLPLALLLGALVVLGLPVRPGRD